MPTHDSTAASRPVKGLIFDLGGTLIYNHPEPEDGREQRQCAAIARLAADELGCSAPKILAERLLALRNEHGSLAQKDLLERRARDTIAEGLREAGLATDHAFLERAERLLFEPDRGRPLYPGARELLVGLRNRGLRLALISNWSSHWIVTDIVATAGIGEYFSPVVSSASYGRIKPHPSIFQYVLDTWSLDPVDAIMVGDTLVTDVLGAERVGMRSILVEVEPNPANARAEPTIHPTYIARHLLEIPALLGIE